MGILLGYVLKNFKDMKLNKTHLKIGWYVSTVSLLLAFFGPGEIINLLKLFLKIIFSISAPMGDINYEFNATHAAHYAAFAPIAWCLFFGWVILTSQLGYQSKFIVL